MSLGVEGLVAFVLFVLPGVFARAEAQRVAPIPADRLARSWIRELADALAYTAILVPFAGGLGVLALWLASSGKLGLLDVFVSGPTAGARFDPVSTVVAAMTYVYSGMLLGGYLGASRIPARLRAWLVDNLKLGEGLSDESIWWSVLEVRAREVERTNKWIKSDVALNVHLAGGGRYTGILLYFPVVADTEADRDLAMWKARYYAPGSEAAPLELDPNTVILLNSRDCIAIEVRYAERTEAIQMGAGASSVTAASRNPS